ncbi:MAG TPA: GTP pyrophosphokinase family protein [Bacilli bacterium]
MISEDKVVSEFNWDVFLQPYELAINDFIIKLESMKKQYILKEARNPIESITGRIKTPTSILEKAKRLNVSFSDIPEYIQDIGGIRITCKYLKDVYEILELLQSRKDIEIVLIKDYIKNPKPSGYRSLHIIAKHIVETIDGQKPIYIEFQVRTLAMHLWASIEHSLKYKYYQRIPDAIKIELRQAAEITRDLDEKMSKIQEEVASLGDALSRKEYELEWEEHMINRGSL